MVGEAGPQLAGPGDRFTFQNFREQVDLLLEQLLVVRKIETEERERLRK